MPEDVLTDALAAAINGRKVRTAVFTTYTFDPGFFERNILPALFDLPFSQVDKIRLIRLEEALRSLNGIAVYYDRTALSQDALPAQLDFRRIDVSRSTGVFHPKLVFLLVENPLDADDENDDEALQGPLSLIVGTLSANLTRPGWWENVETAHFEEIQDKDYSNERCSFRKDLLAVIRGIRNTAAPDEDHLALDRIHDFLRKRTNQAGHRQISAGGRLYTRLFCGQSSLSNWLQDLRLGRREWNIEIISPYFDKDHAGTLEAILDVLPSRAVRVFLPTNFDGSAAVSEELYDAIAELDGVEWCSLPKSLLQPGGRSAMENVAPRRVHAKVYRFWRHNKQDLVFCGSVNLTSAGHSHRNAGNLEAAFLTDITDYKCGGRWWLEPLAKEPAHFTEDQEEETDRSQEISFEISVRYDWSDGTLCYRAEDKADVPLEICEPNGKRLFLIENPRPGNWIDCGPGPAEQVGELLRSTSFLLVRHAKGEWRILVREEGMHQRPSLMEALTPEEILMYWSLLSPEQKEWFIERKVAGELEGLSIGKTRGYVSDETVFDRFAGVYHAFERLFRHVDRAIRKEETSEAEARMFGAKYDSLPVLLDAILERRDGDPVMGYVTFLCANQVLMRVAARHSDFVGRYRQEVGRMKKTLEQSYLFRESLNLPDDEDRDLFLDWYEKSFLRMIEQPGDVA